MRAKVVVRVSERFQRLPRLVERQLCSAAAIILALVVVSSESGAAGPPAERKPAAPPKTTSARHPERPPLSEVKPMGPIARQYCEAVREAAIEARDAHAAASLSEMAHEIETGLARLEARLTEVKRWLAKRKEFADKSSTQLVGIYSAMRPEAASQQLVRIDPAIAASIIAKLDARTASTILNDMPPEKAAELTTVLASLARGDEPRPTP